MWDRRRPVLQLAEFLGVAIWIVVMAGLDEWLLRRGRQRVSRALGLGALAFAVIQGILALLPIPRFVFIYLPFVLMLEASRGAFARALGSRFAMTLFFTIGCGLNALLGVLLLAGIYLLFSRRPTVDSEMRA